MVKREEFVTDRPEGRRDYQLIYVAAGAGRFSIDGREHRVGAGGAVLYRPGQRQFYRYLLAECPEIYWLHFSGAQAEGMLVKLQFHGCGPFEVTYQSEYPRLFDRIISELQLKRAHYEGLSISLVAELLTCMSRGMLEQGQDLPEWADQIQRSVALMYRDFRRARTVSQYAQAVSMSESWFIRCFKAKTGQSPQQFIIGLRMAQAKDLLRSSPYNITEIASMVGYEDPLYFSRLFKKAAGCSPSQFRGGRDAAHPGSQG